jgi:peptide/nickel transport system substrate-binding protein
MEKISRRQFLKFTGLFGLSTLAACTAREKIVTQVVTQIVQGAPEEKVVTQMVTQMVAGTPEVKVVTQVVEATKLVEATRIVEATAKPAKSTVKSQLPVDITREDMFVADQIFRYGTTGQYNLHIPSANTPHRHALMMETFWYRDQETGARLYGVAKSDPIYNTDFTTMQVDLRDNIAWSDGTKFTADDVVYTIETTLGNPALTWNPDLTLWVDKIEKLSDFSVLFTFKTPNPRFHSLFEARWNGVYMMPKHIFETVADLATYTFEKPVVLGAYVPIQFDPTGFWELFQIRDDWDKTPAGITVGQPGPKYVLTIFYGDSTKKAIAMSRHELDVFFDADFEAFKSVIETTPSFRSWYKDFPWAYPNEVDSRHIAFNLDDPIYSIQDVRWAMTLALDVVDMQTNYIGGVAKVTAIPVAPTSALMAKYHTPLEEWLTNFELEIEPGTMYKPYDPTVPDQIRAWAEKQGYTIPGESRAVFGTGWWKYAPDVAERLLVKNGFKKDGGKWLKPDGKEWVVDLQSPPDENDAYRMANAAKDQWTKFGLNVNLQGLERATWDLNVRMGQFGLYTPWYSWSLADGDAWPQIQSLRSDRYVPIGTDTNTTGGTGFRLKDTKIDQFIADMEKVSPNTEANFDLVKEFLKYWVGKAYFITQIGFKKFVTWDEQYWTGFPTSENPIYMPLYWFHGGKFTFEILKPAA